MAGCHEVDRERDGVRDAKHLVALVRKAAGAPPTSAWLADAAARKLRSQGLLDAVHEWETVHGALSDRELRKAQHPKRFRRRAK